MNEPEQITDPVPAVPAINPLIPDGVENMQLRCIVCTSVVPAKRATSRSKDTCSPACYKALKAFRAYHLQRVRCPACYHPSSPEERKDFREWRKHRGDVREGRGRPPVLREKTLKNALESALALLKTHRALMESTPTSESDVAAMDAEITKAEKLLDHKSPQTA